MKSEPAGMAELRQEIAEKTREIVELVAERNELARRIGQLKTRDSFPLEDDRIEDQLLQMIQKECAKFGVDVEVGSRLLNLLLAESKRVQGIQDRGGSPVTPMMIALKAQELQRKGEKLLRLDVGEPDFHPPRAVLEACSKAMFDFKTHYTPTRGIPALIGALQSHLKKKYDFNAQESQVMVASGGKCAVYTGLTGLLGEGDRCLIIEPNWPAYKEILQYIGARATAIHTNLEDGWEPDTEEVKEAIRSNTKVMVVSYPANPTGKLISPKKFDELMGVANDNGITVLSDEIYTEYSYRECPTILRSRAKKFILTASFSKTWAMTGFRVGYAVSSPEVISTMTKLQGLVFTSVPEFIQYGAIEALRVEQEIADNAAAMKERIGIACEQFDKISEIEYYRPDGAMYVFPRVNVPGFDASAFTAKVTEEKKVTITPGSGFGDYPNHFRISLGNSKETIVEGIRRLGEAIH